MNPETRTLLRVTLPLRHTESERKEATDTADLVDQLMGKKPELRLAFIQTHAANLEDDMIDV